jgi:hypothetical protein
MYIYIYIYIAGTINSTHTDPASYPMSTGDFFPRGKATGNEADHPTSPKAKVKDAWSYSPTPSNVFMDLCLISSTGIAFPCFIF